MKIFTVVALYFFLWTTSWNSPSPWAFDQEREDYFSWQVEQIEEQNDLTNWTGEEDLEELQQEARSELYEMLGLDPRPEKTSLHAVVTGKIEYDSFIVEKVYFESIPGLFVTANLYRPKYITGPLPTILYVCGHATVKTESYNYGSKAHYQHHPAWYAKNGYICLILDTVELGEIEGIHHGTYRYGRWWWNSRGYTPAGVEAWNGIRAIDYLLTRPEVAPDKIGVTGRSGGGATSWWIGALDKRVQVVVPVAGVTDLHNQIVDDCVGKHCDCMFFLNKHRWDFAKLGMLIAPRPLLIANADRDPMFPLDGVYRVHKTISKVYAKLNASEKLALNIVGGGHQDIQEIQIHPFRWFNHFLKGQDNLIDIPARKYLEANRLRVYADLPPGAINQEIDELFVPRAPSILASLNEATYEDLKVDWMAHLENDIFGNWPAQEATPELEFLETLQAGNLQLDQYRIRVDKYTHLPFMILHHKDRIASSSKTEILDDENWTNVGSGLNYLFEGFTLSKVAPNEQQGAILSNSLGDYDEIVFLSMRGAGPAAFSGTEHEQTQLKRKYPLVGQTLESMQTWDIVQNFMVLNKRKLATEIYARKQTASMSIYAAIFADGQTLHLNQPTLSHNLGPAYPSVLKYFDLPAAMLMCAEKNNLLISNSDVSVLSGAEHLIKDDRFQLSFE